MSLFEINQDSGQEENYAILSGDQPVIPSISDAATDEFYYSIKKRVYLAARDGFELLIPSLLNTIPSEEVRNVLVNQEYIEDDGQILTPLVVAARAGREKVVRMLLANYKMDLDKKCTVRFDGHFVHGASALWCASGMGHLNIIKLLVKHGANINFRTSTDSTPLRAACFDGRLDIVQYLVKCNADINLANAYNNTNLMISAFKGHLEVVDFLLENGANPDEQAHCGATAMHYAAESGHTEICQSLLDHNAVMMKNEYGMSPVITAAERTKEAVVAMYCERENLLTTEEKLEAYELIGASFANDKDNYSLQKAYYYLSLAMNIRYEDTDNVIRRPTVQQIPAYENWIECQTVQDLIAIQFNHNSLHMESLSIRERILTVKCPEVAHPVVFRGAVCADNGRFDRCELLWLHALELRQNNNLSVQRDLLRFAQVFSQMLHLNVEMRVHNVIKVLEACVVELQRNKDKIVKPGPKDDPETILDDYEVNVLTSLYLLTIITRLLKNKNTVISGEELMHLYRMVYKLNKMNLTARDGQSLLHLAVNGISPVDDFHTSDICKFPCIDTVRILLHCGATVNCFDCDRSTPLHVLASTFQLFRTATQQMLTMVEEISKLFIDAGVHLDAVNKDGRTASEVCTSLTLQSYIKKHEICETSLRCLASRVITKNRLNYKDTVPKNLETFIQLHSAEKI